MLTSKYGYSYSRPITCLQLHLGQIIQERNKQTISLQIFLRLSSANFTWSVLQYFFSIIFAGTEGDRYSQAQYLVLQQG